MGLEDNAKRLNNIATTGTPRAAQTARAVAATKKVVLGNVPNEVVNETSENAGQNIRGAITTPSRSNVLISPPVRQIAPVDNTRVAPIIR